MSSDAQAAFGQPSERERPSTLGYWLAGLIGVAAVAGAVGWFVTGFTGLGGAVDDLGRVPVPGRSVVELGEGKQAVYWEGDGNAPPLRITVRRVDGPALDVGPHGGEVSYDVGGHHGVSVAGFTVPEAGRYRVSVTSERQGIVAVGEGVGGRIVTAIVGGLGIFFGGLLLCGLLIILTARARRA